MTDTTAPAAPETPEAPAAEPVLRVEKGDPTPEELAALLLVVAAASGSDEEEQGTEGIWAHRGRGMRVSSFGQRNRGSWAWRTARR